MNSVARATDLPQMETTGTPLPRHPIAPAPPANGNNGSSAVREQLNRLLRRMRESEFVLKMMLGSFRALQRVGITVIPNHFYWPVPDMRDLESRAWQDNVLPVGFDLNMEEQVRFVQELSARYRSEWSFPVQAAGPSEYHYNNGLFETVDAEMTYSVVRHFKPSRIIEVGGGFSTRVMAAALNANRLKDDREGELITVEPFPSPALKGITNLISTRIQDVDMDLFLSLKDGDILFLDSSHVVSVGSDVVREYLEILPRLNPGVIVHVHDIFLPSDYPREAVLTNLCFWSEQYLLQAFLTFNPQFDVFWGSSAMQQYHPEVLMESFPRWEHSYRDMKKDVRQYLPTRDRDRVWPSSFWMRRVSA
jgi:predicted O-methyltransferase YrrM